MELNKTQHWFYALTSFFVIFILTLGSWWLYLFFKLAHKLNELNLNNIEGNLVFMLKWEGLTFFVILLSLAIALYYVFLQDQKKTKSLQAFFASLTHELKTPLASIRLQSQVLNELLDDLSLEEKDRVRIKKYGLRLQDDSIRLENELDKHLQLSRLERNAPLNSVTLSLETSLKKEFSKFPQLKFNIFNKTQQDLLVLVDEFAFSMIMRNLIENTARHSHAKEIDIDLEESGQWIKICYNDHGDVFQGKISELGKLFYKHNSPKGAGIGLYLINKLTKQMEGKFIIKQAPNLIFQLFLKKGKHE